MKCLFLKKNTTPNRKTETTSLASVRSRHKDGGIAEFICEQLTIVIVIALVVISVGVGFLVFRDSVCSVSYTSSTVSDDTTIYNASCNLNRANKARQIDIINSFDNNSNDMAILTYSWNTGQVVVMTTHINIDLETTALNISVASNDTSSAVSVAGADEMLVADPEVTLTNVRVGNRLIVKRTDDCLWKLLILSIVRGFIVACRCGRCSRIVANNRRQCSCCFQNLSAIQSSTLACTCDFDDS